MKLLLSISPKIWYTVEYDRRGRRAEIVSRQSPAVFTACETNPSL